ncbi:Transcription factor jun-B [Larimichthys crocea]|uniref:Transcription factor jun-B n=1 Tax=Larimichthys crocea TaxID=215358 RepID=A0A6G0HV07_LARCR|nr:Transcription factor jun-B [Larimichthys crocea]
MAVLLKGSLNSSYKAVGEFRNHKSGPSGKLQNNARLQTAKAEYEFELDRAISQPEIAAESRDRALPGGHQDVGSLKLASPELERLIIQNSNGVITTPTPGQYFYNRGITDEQEGFAEGFVKALDELHKMNQMPPPNVSIGAGGVTTCSAAASSVFGSALQPEPPIYTTLNAYCPNTSLSSASSYPTATISYLPPHQQSHPQTSTHGAHAFQHSLPGSGLHPQRS